MPGGYREGSGRSKSGYYKSIYCGSTYELAWVIYQLDHDIPFQRFPGYLEFGGRKYYPDFLQNGKIVEIKGYEAQDSVDAKTLIANKNGYEVEVLRKPELKSMFDWVIDKYHTKKFQTLFDAYQPSFNYTCANCNGNFSVDYKKKTDVVYCSRKCAGQGAQKVPLDEVSKKQMYERVSSSLRGKSPSAYKRKKKMFWITDGSTNSKIEVGTTVPTGFKKGRTILRSTSGEVTTLSR